MKEDHTVLLENTGSGAGKITIWPPNTSSCAGGWISVKDRLPELFEDVLGYCVQLEDNEYFKSDEKYCSIDVLLQWPHTGEICFRTDKLFRAKVTHWMPLPKPPEDRHE